MQIDSVRAYHVALPYRRPMPMPPGAFEPTSSIDALHTVLVRMQSGSDVGWGEASPGAGPWTSDEWAAGVFLCLHDWLIPTISGTNVDSATDLQEKLNRFRGNRYAKSAIDTAWWDLQGKRQGKPLHRLLGADRDATPVGPVFDRMETIENLIDAAGSAQQAGFSRIGLKFRPGWDVSMVHFVRQELPIEQLHVECDGDLRLEHMEMLCRLDDFMLAMIVQPLSPDDLVGHAMVQETIRTPICLAEGASNIEKVDMALDLHSCKYVKIEPGRSGGLTPAMAIHDRCRAGGIPCWVGAVPQSAIGTRLGLALAAKDNCTYPADYLFTEDLLAADLAEPAAPTLDPSDNVQRVKLSDQPGIGIEPNAATLEKYTVAKSDG